MFRTIRKKIFRLAFVSGAGAAAAYFFDKDRGVQRRAQVKDKASGVLGKASAGGSWQAQTEHTATGFEPRVVPPSPAPPAPPVPTATATAPPAPADTISSTVTDTTPGTAASPTAPIPGA
jgi:hypothetical protein